MAETERLSHIGVNLLVLTDRPPGGTGYHAISLFEALVAAECEDASRVRVTGFATEVAALHFSEQARSRLVLLPPGRGWRRVANELVCLPRAARELHVDLVINPAFFGAPWGSPRRALIIHDLYFRSDPELVPVRRRMLLKFIVPLLGHRSDTIFTVSQATRKELQRFYPSLGSRATVLHSGNRTLQKTGRLEDLVSANTLPSGVFERPFLLMVGHLTSNKRPETVVAALAALKSRGRDLALVHVGEDAGRLAPLAGEAGLAKDVVSLGPQPDSILAACYSQCEALLIPSIREGFGLPLIEAQACGAPVIASSCAALIEIGGDSALYFHVEAAQECAEAVLAILNDPERRRTLIKLGYENCARFSWDRTASRLLETLGVEAGLACANQPADE